MKDISIERSDKNENKAQKTEEPAVNENIVTWQFRYRSYREVANYIDETSPLTRSGMKQKKVIKARNWRRDLDLSNPEDKKEHEYLLAHKDRNNCFWLLSEKKENQAVKDDAETLKKLFEMDIPQLMTCIDQDEWKELNMIGEKPDKFKLIAAIMKIKTFGNGGK